MNSTHVFEPTFSGVSPGKLPVSGKSAPEAAMRMIFGLLERLHLCRAPRIINAQCLLDKPGIVSNEA